MMYRVISYDMPLFFHTLYELCFLSDKWFCYKKSCYNFLSFQNIQNFWSKSIFTRGTVRENIAYSKPDVTDKQIEDACKAVGLHHYIMSLPNGYDTVLDDKATLSQGQKQLLTIARAMVEDAPILILDEATSSVDTRTEELIQKAMDALTVDRTSFVIAHRLSTIRDADMILVMNHGDIVESGTHEELLAKGGFYADIYNSQFALTD